MARSRASSASPPSTATSAAFLLSVCTYEPTHGRRRHEHHAAHGEVLAELGDQRATLLVDRLTARRASRPLTASTLDCAGGERRLGDFGGEAAEVIATRDEIGLAVHFDQHAGLAVGGLLDDDHAFGGDSRGLLVGLGETRLAHVLGGGVRGRRSLRRVPSCTPSCRRRCARAVA